MNVLAAIATLYTILIINLRFAYLAPLTQDREVGEKPAQDENVKELESLKNKFGKTLEVIKAHSTAYTDSMGNRKLYSSTDEQMKEDGNLVAKINQEIESVSQLDDPQPVGKVKTAIEVPSENIHKSRIQDLPKDYAPLTENGNRRSESQLEQLDNTVDNSNGMTGTQYSPLDMAEYVFWTGDERGVSLAVEEFLQEGLMTREDAISFLQEIKYNLDYLKSHYTQLGLNSQLSKEQQQPNAASVDQTEALKYPNFEKQDDILQRPEPELQNEFDISRLKQEVSKKRNQTPLHLAPSQDGGSGDQQKMEDGKDNEKMLEKLRLADFLYTEYSLEEVIYQLAKVMFAQSLSRSNTETQEALEKFTSFLEKEAEQGRISKTLEKTVLDVLIASLSDTLAEHPEFVQNVRPSLSPFEIYLAKQNFLKKILEFNQDNIMNFRNIPISYKDHFNGNQVQLGMKQPKLAINFPLTLENYKNH